MTNLLDHIAQSIRARKLLSRGERILVAVSGGLDSVTLLHGLHTLAANQKWKLTVAHLNHQLRGRASNADERFVRAMSARLKLPCVTGRADVRAHAKKHGLSLEMSARELRHEFLAHTARRLRIRRVALAHHADDQVELFFIRLLRGTGGAGLAGMKGRAPSPANSAIQLVRPLLNVSKVDLEQFAREFRIRFREDASNTSLDIQRNRIRHELLPWLRRRFQPALDKIVLRAMDIVGAEAGVVTEAAQACLKLKRQPLSGWSVGLLRRVIQLQLQQCKIAADFELVESLRLNPGKIINVNPRISVTRDAAGRLQMRAQTSVAFNAKQIAVPLDGRAGEAVFEGVRFQWRFDTGKRRKRAKGPPRHEFFDADQVGAQVVLRHWQAGDRFQPIGRRSTVKLQDWFTNQKIPRARRREFIVAATAAGEIFWIENQRIGERFKLTPQTKRRLIWRWKRL